MTEVISPQFVLVDGVPCYVKDLPPRYCVTLLEEDSDGTPESEAESLLCGTEDTESDNSLEEGAVPLCRSTRQKRLPPDYHIWDHEISWSVVREETNLLDQSM